jgi:hypothetical protein
VSVRQYYPYRQNVGHQGVWLTRIRKRFLMILLHADITMGTPSMGPFGSFKYVNWSVNDDGTPYKVIYIYILFFRFHVHIYLTHVNFNTFHVYFYMNFNNLQNLLIITSYHK